ncbi:hypothetical protein ACKC6W_000659 [Vibrio vulnificus]|uniref:hypothetical protein n=1 Tax=Vibrio vulnificus TaxID=672 RepID=UPI00102B922D|nr:hypothetical protein [Vibrio vulnificus]RZR16065.1 hypothetical protein D8T44_07185 [Vibrio vulnificus]
MSGEDSKSSGETGENIVSKFFKKVGWPNSNPNISFPCHFGTEHPSDADGPRTKHGIDEHFSYLSSLETETLVHILASVKHTTGDYPKSFTNKIKGYVDDIIYSSVCFRVSDHNADTNAIFSGNTIKNVKYVPVLFYLSSKEDKNKDYFINISNTQYFKKFENEGIEEFYVVDNSKFTFMLNAIDHVTNHYSGYEIFFGHTSTSLNRMSFNQRSYSSVMPVEYLTLPYLTFVLRKNIENEEVFKCVVVANEPFSQDSLSRHTYSALQHSDRISSVSICFPDFFLDEHKGDVSKVMQAHNITEQKLRVENYIPNFRNLTNE